MVLTKLLFVQKQEHIDNTPERFLGWLISTLI